MLEYRIGRLNGKFVVSWWDDGKRRRYRLGGATIEDAKREAIDVVRRERAQPSPTTIGDFWEAYRAEKMGRRVATAMGYEWKAVGAFWGHYRPDQITIPMCREYAAQRRAAGIQNGSIWTELGRLRTVLRWALGDKAPRIERPSKPAPKERYLTHEEIDRLLAVRTAPHIYLAILLMLSTAARVGAVLDLKWERVDLERGQINLRADALGPRKGRAVVPINAGLRAALQAARLGALSDFVVEWNGVQVANIKTGFYKAARAAGLPDISPHVLRHTAAVHLAVAGVPMERISQYLGHTDVGVTQRVYARFAPDHLREEAAILDFTTIRQVQADPKRTKRDPITL